MGNQREAERREALRREALRVHARYASEVVEALDFCPFSAPARAAGRVQTRVLFGREPSLDALLLRSGLSPQTPASPSAG